MKKIYAIFKNEEDAQKAINKLSAKEKGIKTELILSNSKTLNNDSFKFDADIIGSPLPMASQFDTHGYENANITPNHAGLSAFCYADFVATSKNSLSSSEKENLPFNDDTYGAALALKIPRNLETGASKILTEVGGKVIN